jgi:hypothetical protein
MMMKHRQELPAQPINRTLEANRDEYDLRTVSQNGKSKKMPLDSSSINSPKQICGCRAISYASNITVKAHA